MGGITSFRAREFYQWMLFVDGENLTMCAQRLATVKGFALREGPHYLKDVHLWLPGAKAFMPITSGRIDLASRSLRCLYYTSVQGDDAKREGVRKNLWGMGFEPIVHKRREGKSKAVDIRLTTDIRERSVIPVPGQQLGVTLRGTDEFLEDLVAASGHLGLEALLPAVGREVLHAGARL